MELMDRLFEGPLAKQLFIPPEVTLQIRGTPSTDDATKEIDFDIKIDCSKYMRINSEEYLTKREHGHRKSSGWLNNRLVERDRRRSWIIRKVVAIRDDELATLGSNVMRLALGSSYTGVVEFELCTPPVSMKGLPDEYTAVARVVWDLDCSFIVSQGLKSSCGTASTLDPWYDLIACAMIEGVQRFISPQNPPSLYNQFLNYRTDAANTDVCIRGEPGAHDERILMMGK